MSVDPSFFLKNIAIKDGSIWRDILGPELTEFFIAQAWDDISKGLHKDMPPQYRDDHGRYGTKISPLA